MPKKVPTCQDEVSFEVSKSDALLIRDIVKRAVEIAANNFSQVDRTSLTMDLTACHANGCPLKLEALLKANNFNFVHDVFGIRRHIDRNTAQLRDCFLPRFARTEQELAHG